jgi:alpha-glucosidase
LVLPKIVLSGIQYYFCFPLLKTKMTIKLLRSLILQLMALWIAIHCSAGISAHSMVNNISKELKSPSGQICGWFLLTNGHPMYSIIYRNDTLIRPSSLGFVLQNNDSLTSFELIETSYTSFDETWATVWGTSSQVRNQYNELLVKLKDTRKDRLLNLYFRCYDDGFAFRYEFPQQQTLNEVVIISEESRINFSGSFDCWWSWADYNTLEKKYYHTPLDSATHVATPFTLRKSNGTYICVHEAAIDDYSTMTLKRVSGDNNLFQVNLVPWADGTLVKAKVPFKSPWRVFFISDRAGGLIESNLLYNLNEPSVIENVSWIKPMTYIGIWWEMHLGISTWKPGSHHGATTENAKRYIDFAASHNIKGFLVEGWNTGWENWGEKNAFDFVTPYPDFNLKEVVTYANSKGVSFIGHHETGGDTKSYEEHIEAAFSLYQQLGVHAVKTGYAGPVVPEGEYHHGQCMVQHYNKVMRLAAKYQIMLDVHEPIILSGLSRTYPNLMTAEGVRGMEWNAWSDGNMPSHTCTLPFTRGMAGPMDYTPGIFDIDLSAHTAERKKWNWLDTGNTAVHSTLVNQLALMVVLYSPLQMAADLPENYSGNKAFDFIENLPTTWDETRVIDAAIGEYIVIARRKGDKWFIGAITNEVGRKINVPLSFLNSSNPYKATQYLDALDADYIKNPEAYNVTVNTVKSNETIYLLLAPGGGAAIILDPEYQQ